MRHMLLVAALLALMPAHAALLECDTLCVQIDESTGRVVLGSLPDLDRTLDLTGGLVLTEGIDARPIALADAAFAAADAGATLDFAPADEDLRVSLGIALEGGWLAWNVELENTGDRQRLLSVALEISVPSDGPISCYDGHEEFAALTKSFDGPPYRRPLPLCAAWSDEGGVAVGLNPRQSLSFIATRGEPLDAGGARVDVRTHIVLDPGQTLPLQMFMCGLTGQWGRGEALHWYYTTAPELFAPNPDIDPRTLFAGAQYAAWRRNPGEPEDFQVRETLRRTRAGWDWCINPFRRAGDIVGRPELWDYTPALPGKMADEDKLSFDEYHAARAERFATGERLGSAMFFYTPSQIWCEEQLARERYPDSLTEDPAERCRYTTGYVKPHDGVVRVFPYNTSYAEQSERDLADVADELALRGFAFDTATGGARYSGPGIADLPERGWDEDGPFVREAVAIRHMEDYVHSLRHADGSTLAVVANIRSSADYNSCMGADGALFEGEPWKGGRGEQWCLRDSLGSKPACWWEHYALDSFVDYKNMTRDEIAAAYQGIADFTCIESLRMGFWPTTSYARGFESMARRYLPRIEACTRAGWQPLTAVRSDDFTWVTRYGRDFSTHIAYGNETAEPDGEAVTTQVGEETLTLTGVRAPRRSAEVVVAAATISADPGATITASWSGDGLSRTLALQLRDAESHARNMMVAVPAGMVCRQIRVDGEPARVIRAGQSLVAATTAAEPTDLLVEVDFVSAIIEGSRGQLLARPFLFEDQPGGWIVLPETPTPAEELAAERIVHYFQYYLRVTRDVEDPTAFPIVRGEPPKDDSLMIMINRQPSRRPRVVIPDVASDVLISAPDAAGLQRAVDALLAALDDKYVATPPFVWRRSTNQAGLIGASLPDPAR